MDRSENSGNALPYGWSAQIAPNGMTYYVNPIAMQATWIRPRLKDVRAQLKKHVKGIELPKNLHERAVRKFRIGSTQWYLILTNRDNLFYFNMEIKKSSWRPPKGVREVLQGFIQEVREKRKQEIKEKKIKEKGEKKKSRKRKRQEVDGKNEKDISPLDSEESEDEGKNNDKDNKKDKNPPPQPEPIKEKSPEPEMYRPDLSEEERKTIFIDMLSQTNADPFSSWDVVKTLVELDERFRALPNDELRYLAFEDYARAKLEERKAASRANVDPATAFQNLLKETIRKKIYWEDFRRKYRKDSRFQAFGKSDREREKVFRTFMREFEVRKNKDPIVIKADFLDLLKTVHGLHRDSRWRDVKEGIRDDERYDAVGSSSKRQDWFEEYVGGLSREMEFQDQV